MKSGYFNETVLPIRETFKELRIARGYTQADVSDEVVSKSLISKFENGTNMLAADKLFHAISNLNMTPNEFVSVMNHYQPDRMQKLYMTLNQIRFSGPQGVEASEKLIIDKTNDKFEMLSNIMLKSVLQDVTGKIYISTEERIFVGNYLNGIENWTEFEVRLLGYACPILDIGDFRWFGELLLERTGHFYTGALKNLFFGTLMTLYEGVIEHQELQAANFFRTEINKLEFLGMLDFTINLQILKYLHDYTENRTKENLIRAYDYLDKVEALGVKAVVVYFRERFTSLEKK